MILPLKEFIEHLNVVKVLEMTDELFLWLRLILCNQIILIAIWLYIDLCDKYVTTLFTYCVFIVI